MYQVYLEQFQGPYQLLLNLIEKEKLDITEVSLGSVTNGFLNYLEKIKGEESPEELADFLDIAAKLLLIKSRLLIPGIFEEEPSENLVEQLKIYREFLEASKKIEKLVLSDNYSFAREKIAVKLENAPINININLKTLKKNFENVIAKLSFQIKLNKKIVRKKIVSLEKKIEELLGILKYKNKFILNDLIDKRSKDEKVAIFLAILELAKKREIIIKQKQLFDKIFIEKINKPNYA